MQKRVLHFPLKKKWYKMIESGEKPEEYRPHKVICHQCEYYGATCPVTSQPCSKAPRDEKVSRWIVCGVAAIIVIVMFIVL